MKRKNSGFHCGPLQSIKPVLKEWIKANSEIAKLWRSGRDAPWWYGERASLSVFAGAIWRVGGFCFEEYSETKKGITRETKKHGDSYPGRVDLYFSLPHPEFVAEAKFVSTGFTRNNDNAAKKLRDRLKKVLKSALDDVQKSPPGPPWKKLGIVFTMPYFRKNCKLQKVNDVQKVNDGIDRWIEVIADLKPSGYAWVFPECTRTLKSWDNQLYCPGAAVIIQQEK